MTDTIDIRTTTMARRQPRPFGTVFLLIVSLSMVVFSLYGAQANVFGKAREAVLDVFAPVISVMGAPVRWVGGQVGHVEDYFRLQAENRRLREENDELRVWMQEALSLRRQLSYYETILETQLPAPAQYVDAQVIGENGGPFRRSLILSAGRGHGVQDGNAVVDDAGLLGHIVSSGEGAARVLLLTDAQSRIPVFLEDLQVDALLAGRSTGRPVLEFFEKEPTRPLQPGVRLVTSGAGGLLPRGIPVGMVESVNENAITVIPFANYRTPDLVRVVDFTFPNDLGEPGSSIDG